MFRLQGRLVDNLPKVYGLYTGGFIVFIILMAILDKLGASIRGLVTGIMGPGSDGGMAQAFGKLGDLIFGKTETFSADVDAMGQSFEKFRQMGNALYVEADRSTE